MALVCKVHIQGGNNNTAPFLQNHPYIGSCKFEISAAATYVGMVMWEGCCVITAPFYVHYVDQCHPYIFMKSFLYYLYTRHM